VTNDDLGRAVEEIRRLAGLAGANGTAERAR